MKSMGRGGGGGRGERQPGLARGARGPQYLICGHGTGARRLPASLSFSGWKEGSLALGGPVETVLSPPGDTASPKAQPLPTRELTATRGLFVHR